MTSEHFKSSHFLAMTFFFCWIRSILMKIMTHNERNYTQVKRSSVHLVTTTNSLFFYYLCQNNNHKLKQPLSLHAHNHSQLIQCAFFEINN